MMFPISGIKTIFFLFSTSVAAQEAPSIPTTLYGEKVHRQNVCDRHKQYYQGKVELRNALEGLELRPLIIETRLFQLDNGVINAEDPGLIVEIIDELAKRAGFTWRTSYAFADGPGEGHSWSDLYVSGAETYDFVADWCLNTAERLRRGLGFPRGFYDGSYILVGKKVDVEWERGSMRDLFGWLRVFKPSVWWAILATILLSAAVFSLLEILNSKGKQKKWYLGRNVFLSFMLTAGQFEFQPKAHGARLVSVSMSFWALILCAAYTANLLSFLVVPDAPSRINSIDDVIKAGMPICLEGGSGIAAYVKEKYPTGIYIEKETTPEIYDGIKAGECPFAVTAAQSWKIREGDSAINGDCDLAWIGRTIKFVDAGFGVKADSGTMCTGLIQDVFHLHMIEMIDDGFIDSRWARVLQKSRDINCNAQVMTAETDAPRLNLNDMSGVFFLLFIGAVIAFIFSVLRKVSQRYKKKHDAKADSDCSNDLVSAKKRKLKKRHINGSAARIGLRRQLVEVHINLNAMEQAFFNNRKEIQKLLTIIISQVKSKRAGNFESNSL